MPKKEKIELVIIHTDADGNETRHTVKKMNDDIETAKWWVKKAIDHQVWEDNQPEAGMASGCW